MSQATAQHGVAVRVLQRAPAQRGCRSTDADPAAVVEQGLHDRAAHRAGRAGDHGDLVLQRSRGVHVSSTLFLPNRPRERKVTTAMNSRYIDISDHSDA